MQTPDEKNEKKDIVKTTATPTATAAPAVAEKQSESKQGQQRHGQQKPGQQKKGAPQQMTREQRTEQKIARQIDLVKSGNYATVPRRALETNAAIALLAKNDFLVDRLRDRLVSDPSIDVAEGIAALQKNQEIRKELNALNAKMCELMGLEYEAPRGFETSGQEDKGNKAA